MVVGAVLLTTFVEGGWAVVTLLVLGLFVLLSSYDRGEGARQ